MKISHPTTEYTSYFINQLGLFPKTQKLSTSTYLCQDWIGESDTKSMVVGN